MCQLSIWLTWLTLSEGNYRNFRVGKQVCFSLETFPRTLSPVVSGPSVLEKIELDRYRFRGPVIYRHEHRQEGRNFSGDLVATTETFCVIEPGPRVYTLDHNHSRLPSEMPAGSWWEGEAALCVAWHFFERYNGLPDLPPLVYTWAVEQIFLEEAPWITRVDCRGDGYRTKDTARRVLTEVGETSPRTYPQCDYILRCRQLGPAGRERLPETVGETELAVAALLGSSISLTMMTPREGSAGTAEVPLLASLVRISDSNPRLQQALLRMQTPLVFAGVTYDYAVAIPRYEDDSIRGLAIAGSCSCVLRPIPSELALSEIPFDRLQWPTGESLIGEMRKP